MSVESGLAFLTTSAKGKVDVTSFVKNYLDANRSGRRWNQRRIPMGSRPVLPAHEGIALQVREGRERLQPSCLGTRQELLELTRGDWSNLLSCSSQGTSGVGDGSVRKLRKFLCFPLFVHFLYFLCFQSALLSWSTHVMLCGLTLGQTLRCQCHPVVTATSQLKLCSLPRAPWA